MSECRNETQTDDGRWVESEPLPFYDGAAIRLAKRVKEKLDGARFELRYHSGRIREKAIMAFVWRLPRTVVHWATVRVWAHATTGPYGETDVTELTVTEAIKRWEAGEHPREYGPSADDDPLEEKTEPSRVGL